MALKATVAVACLLFAQAALAKSSGYGNQVYTAPVGPSKPAYSGGKSAYGGKDEPSFHDVVKAKFSEKKSGPKPSGTYCFPATLPKANTVPSCPAGYGYSDKYNQCYAYGADSCAHCSGFMVKDRYGAKACATCKHGYEYNAAAGQCEKSCKDGYTEQVIKGAKYCVQDCKKGHDAVGQDCVNFEKSYKPFKCAEKLCPLAFKLYFTADKPAYGKPAYGKHAYSATPAAGYSSSTYGSSGSSCICAITRQRDVYPKDCKDPEMQGTKRPVLLQDPVCWGGGKVNHKGDCPGVCPTGCSEGRKGECLLPCPSGYKACPRHFGPDFCAKINAYVTSYGSGYDPCEVVKKMEKKLDEDCVCPVAKPAPLPATKPGVVVASASASATTRVSVVAAVGPSKSG